MKVSILIPLYNSEKYVAQTLECALNQTWSDKEIIVVDDGSTDNSLNIAQSYECDILKVYSQEKKGASATRNYAFSKSTGDYIQYLDADDLLDINKIETQIDFINNREIDKNILIYCSIFLFEEDINIIIPNNYTIGNSSYVNSWELLTDMYQNNKSILPHAYLLPRKLITESGGWNEALSTNDDGEFFSRIISLASKVLFVPKVAVYYRVVPQSLSRRRSEKHAVSEFKSIELTMKLMLNNNNSEKVRRACSKRINLYIQSWYPENTKLLKEVESFMKNYQLEYDITNKSKRHIKIIKYLGWRKTLSLKKTFKNLTFK